MRSRPRIRVKWSELVNVTTALGCESDADRSRLFDVDAKTIHNLRWGRFPVSDQVVAKVLTVMTAHREQLEASGFQVNFDQVFEVGPEPEAA